MSGLASKWADEPDLVEAAAQQDSTKIKTSPTKSTGSESPSKTNAVTSVKGKPLASKWADSSEDEEVQIPAPKPQPKHRSPPKEPKKYRDSPKRHNREDLSSRFNNKLKINDRRDSDEKEQMTPEAKNFAARLGISSNDQPTKPKIQFNKHNKSQHADEEDQWEDEDEEEVENDSEEEAEVEEEEYAPEPLTKAGNSLASRLGLGPASPEKPKQSNKSDIRHKREQERDRLRDERIKANREWDHHKEHNRHRTFNDHRQSHQNRDNRNESRGHYQNHQREHNSRNNKYEHNREHHRAKPEPAPKPEAKQYTEEELAKQAEESRILEEMMQSGGKNINWADFGDD